MSDFVKNFSVAVALVFIGYFAAAVLFGYLPKDLNEIHKIVRFAVTWGLLRGVFGIFFKLS